MDGTEITIRYGRIGTAGQSSSTSYPTVEAAQAEASKKINEKLKKGYIQIAARDDAAAPKQPTEVDSSTASGMSDRILDLATLDKARYEGRRVLGIPVEGSLSAIEVVVTGNLGSISPHVLGAFTINLDAGKDIAFHFDVRPNQRQIAHSTCISGQWGAGNSLTLPPEFTSGVQFTLRIAIEQDIVISLNDRVLDRYTHRLSPTLISTVHIVYYPESSPIQSLRIFDQSVKLFERTDPPTALPAGDRTISVTENPLPQEPASPDQPFSAPPPSTEVPELPPPTLELLNQATLSSSLPPSVAKKQLRSVRYPLGFVFREVHYCDLTIPLPRSLVCFEMVGTFNQLNESGFTIRLSAQKDDVYAFKFDPEQGQMWQWTYVAGVMSKEESIGIPSTIASGQVFHYVLTMTAAGNVVFYLNNQPFSYSPPQQLTAPPDMLRLQYVATGIKLQLARVLEPLEAKIQASHSRQAIASAAQAQQPLSPKIQTISAQETMDMPQFLQDLPDRLEPLRSFLESNLVPYIRFTATEVGRLNAGGNYPSDWGGDPLELWQSKIGGHPYLPKGMSYPADVTTGQMMMFLMQVDCADLPIVDGLNLPRQGLLQFYVGFDVPMCALSPEQHRILYFPEISQDKNDLATDFSFLAEPASAMEWYDHVYALSFSAQQDVFWDARGQLDESLKFPEHLTELRENFEEWIEDYEDRSSRYSQSQGGRRNKLGGYPELHSEVGEVLDGVSGRLLLEFDDESDENGRFYFYIEDSDLANLCFENVKSYIVPG